MEISTAFWEDLDDELPCLAREECIRGLLGDDVAQSLDQWPFEAGEGDDD